MHLPSNYVLVTITKIRTYNACIKHTIYIQTHTHTHSLIEQHQTQEDAQITRKQLEKRLAQSRSAERKDIVHDLQQAMSWARNRRAQLASKLAAGIP